MSEFISLFKPDFILHNAFYGALSVGLFCPLVGVYFYLRRAVLLGVALPQVSSAGVAFAFLLQGLGWHWTLHAGETNDRFMALAGSIIFTLTVIFLLAYLERRRDGTADSRLGAVFVLAFAVSILFVSENPIGRAEFLALLNGDIVSVTSSDLTILCGTYLVLGLILFMLNKQFLLSSFDPETAQIFGKKVVLWDSLLYGLMGLSVSMSVLIVGPMLTFAFLVIPPLAARRFVRRMPAFFLLSSGLGCVSAIMGFYMSYHWDLPLAPSAIVSVSVFLGVSFLFNKIIS